MRQEFFNLELKTNGQKLYEFTNFLSKSCAPKTNKTKALEILAILMQPMTPHLAEEIWSALGNTTTIMKTAWPKVNKNLLQEENVNIPIQINGKKKTEILFPVNSDSQAIEKMWMRMSELAACAHALDSHSH